MMGAMMAAASSVPGWFPAPCHSYPGPQTLPAFAGGVLAAVISDTGTGLVSIKSSLLNVRDSRSSAAFERSHPKRGPPILLF